MDLDPLLISRILFGITAAFHILWPMLSIGISLFLFFIELAYVRTGKIVYYHQLRFWTKIFLLTFVLGVASGIPLEFEFGTNWASFSKSAGDFFCNVLGFEATMAFALEAAFLGIFVFGWKKVPPKIHLLANFMVFVGATLSLFWIMSANSWMQTPAGIVMENGKVVVTSYFEAVFNPFTWVSSLHMWVACIESTIFFMASICAYHILRKERTSQSAEFFLSTFKMLLVIALIIAPLQLLAGDASARAVSEHQPIKAAAMELHWTTNPAGTGAPLAIIALPDKNAERNSFEISVPFMLSFLTDHSFNSTVPGLSDFKKEDRPKQLTAIFYSFRIMVAIGVLMFLLIIWALIVWKKGGLDILSVDKNQFFWKVFLYSWPLGFIATELGWMVREMGRQPWVLYNIMRTKDAVSPNLDGMTALVLLISITLIYVVMMICFVFFTIRLVKQGPDFSELPPVFKKKSDVLKSGVLK